MISKLTLFVSVFAFSYSAFAVKPAEVIFSKIDLHGVQVIEAENRQDSFMRKIKLTRDPSARLIQVLQEESFSQIVSPLYELAEHSAFKNIYVYVGKTAEGKFEFVQIMENRSGSLFVVDMDITDVTKSTMKAVHGPHGEQTHYLIKKTNGNLFPSL